MTQTDRLLYFSARGRAEPIRMLYAIADQPLIDDRISDFALWKTQVKPLQPLGQLPVLTCKEGTLVLSGAIAKYAAKKFNLSGSTAWEEALNDMVMGACIDLHNDIGHKIYHWKIFKFFPEPPNSGRVIEDVKEKIVLTMMYIQSVAEQQETKFIVSDEITVADIYTYCILEYSSVQFPDVLTLNPWIERFVAKFTQEPRVKSYLADRPVSPLGV